MVDGFKAPVQKGFVLLPSDHTGEKFKIYTFNAEELEVLIGLKLKEPNGLEDLTKGF